MYLYKYEDEERNLTEEYRFFYIFYKEYQELLVDKKEVKEGIFL